MALSETIQVAIRAMRMDCCMAVSSLCVRLDKPPDPGQDAKAGFERTEAEILSPVPKPSLTAAGGSASAGESRPEILRIAREAIGLVQNGVVKQCVQPGA